MEHSPWNSSLSSKRILKSLWDITVSTEIPLTYLIMVSWAKMEMLTFGDVTF